MKKTANHLICMSNKCVSRPRRNLRIFEYIPSQAPILFFAAYKQEFQGVHAYKSCMDVLYLASDDSAIAVEVLQIVIDTMLFYGMIALFWKTTCAGSSVYTAVQLL